MRIPSELLDLTVDLAFDCSQMELRILAEVTGDTLLIEQFNSGRDIHCQVGHLLTGWSEERIAADKQTRKLVKNMHFAIIFGISRDGIYDYVVMKVRALDGPDADLSGITKERVQKMYDRYFQVYKGVRTYIDKTRVEVERTHKVTTILGFTREIYEESEDRNTFWGNQAINTPIQSPAHHLVLISLALLYLKKKTYRILQEPVMEIHDAIHWFLKLRDLVEGYQLGKDLMENQTVAYVAKYFSRKLRVPIRVEAQAGFRLGTMVDYEGQPVSQFLTEWCTKYREVEAKSAKSLKKFLE